MSDGFFTISEFAKYSRTTRDTLLHYDKIGLLRPVSRGSNSYRFYSNRQLAIVNVIRTLQNLGMSLDEIRELKDRRTPARTDELFSRQIGKIDGKIDGWIRARKLLLTLRKIIQSVADIDENAVSIQYLPAEAIVMGGINDYSHGRSDYDALLSFYHSADNEYPDLDMNYPVWAVFSGERIKKRDWVWPDRYYFYNPEGRDRKPAALYAIGYTRGGYGHGEELYDKMIDYIEKNGFEICGDTYEEYPINEIFATLEESYLIRVLITVREKNAAH